MSDAIPLESIPQAIIGMQVDITRQQRRELNGNVPADVARVNLFERIMRILMDKHAGDVEVCPLDHLSFSSGVSYRLEIVTFTRKQWIEHMKEWAKLENELTELRAKLIDQDKTIQMDPFTERGNA